MRWTSIIKRRSTISQTTATRSLIKILTCKSNHTHIYYIINSFNSLLGTCIVLAVKYNEETCHFNERGQRFFYDEEFSMAVCIPKKFLIDYQLYFLKVVDHNLFVSEEIYHQYVKLFVEAARTLKEQR